NTPLAYAVINNNLEAATWLLDKGANANALVCLPEKKEDEEDEDTEKLMSMMGLDGLNELAELEEQITEPLEITEDDSSCLMFASGKGNFELVKLLVAAGADIQFKDDDDATALFMAVANGHRDIVEFLVEKGADINCYAGETLLHQACLRANIDMAEYLLGHGLNINAKDDDKSTPLHSAITSSLFNGIEIVEWVINAKADVNALASGKISPLILACQLTNDEAINLLLNYNVDINVVDRDGKTAFDYCVESQQENIDLAKLKPTASNVAVKKKIALIRKFILWRVIPLAILYLVIYIFSTNVANVIVGAIVLWMLYRFIKKKFTPEKPNKMGKMFEGFASAMAKAGEAVEQQEKAKRETRAKWEQSSEQPNIDWVEYLVKQDIITNKAQAYQRLNSVPSLNQASIEEKVAAIVPKSKVAFSRGQFATADNFNDFFSELSLVIASYADCTFSNIELSSAAVSVELNLSGSQHRINAKRLSSDLPPAIIGELRKLLKQQLQLDILATDPMQASIELVILPLKVIDRLRAFA
ncbi:MAG: ankyrin repeat domain-containing protein, partial [Gammaproteobacteria bacterium]|nr:ankyrin repeat domain-containing protein [Gammaproteobacteria bacterium]